MKKESKKETSFERMSESAKIAYIGKFYRHFKGLKPTIRNEIKDYVKKNPKLHSIFVDILS